MEAASINKVPHCTASFEERRESEAIGDEMTLDKIREEGERLVELGGLYVGRDEDVPRVHGSQRHFVEQPAGNGDLGAARIQQDEVGLESWVHEEAVGEDLGVGLLAESGGGVAAAVAEEGGEGGGQAGPVWHFSKGIMGSTCVMQERSQWEFLNEHTVELVSTTKSLSQVVSLTLNVGH